MKTKITSWISDTIVNEAFKEGDINYIFCGDDYLLDINVKYLKHNALTDIISFDYSLGKKLSGDIFISVDRVKDNSVKYEVNFDDELHRVIIHGILHFCGYKDKTKEDKRLMRKKEDYYLSLRTF
jgi:rRNA maturation RNase YbeY